MSFTFASANHPCVKRLVAEGIIPPNCTKFRVIFEVDSVVRIEYQTLATEEQANKITEALSQHKNTIALVEGGLPEACGNG